MAWLEWLLEKATAKKWKSRLLTKICKKGALLHAIIQRMSEVCQIVDRVSQQISSDDAK